MTIESEDIAKIDKHLRDLEIHAKECSKAVVDDALVIGKLMEMFRPEDMTRLYKATGQFYNGCVCNKKVK